MTHTATGAADWDGGSRLGSRFDPLEGPSFADSYTVGPLVARVAPRLRSTVGAGRRSGGDDGPHDPLGFALAGAVAERIVWQASARSFHATFGGLS